MVYKQTRLTGGGILAVGARIRRAREAAELTQLQLAEACGWPDAQTRVSHYESGRTEPTYADMETIAKVTGFDPGWLAFGERAMSQIEQDILAAYRTGDDMRKQFIRAACGIAQSVASAKSSKKRGK